MFKVLSVLFLFLTVNVAYGQEVPEFWQECADKGLMDMSTPGPFMEVCEVVQGPMGFVLTEEGANAVADAYIKSGLQAGAVVWNELEALRMAGIAQVTAAVYEKGEIKRGGGRVVVVHALMTSTGTVIYMVLRMKEQVS